MCLAIINIIKAKREKVNGQIFNLTSFNSRIIDIAKKFKRIFPKTKLLIKKSSIDKRNYKVSSLKAEKMINFKSKVKLTHGISDLVDYVKKIR